MLDDESEQSRRRRAVWWWAPPVFVALVVAAFAAAAFMEGQPLAGVTLLLLAGHHLASRYLQRLAFRDGWHTSRYLSRGSRRVGEPWDPLPLPEWLDQDRS